MYFPVKNSCLDNNGVLDSQDNDDDKGDFTDNTIMMKVVVTIPATDSYYTLWQIIPDQIALELWHLTNTQNATKWKASLLQLTHSSLWLQGSEMTHTYQDFEFNILLQLSGQPECNAKKKHNKNYVTYP